MVVSPINAGLNVVGVDFTSFRRGVEDGTSILVDLRPYGGGLLILCFDLDSEAIVDRISAAVRADVAVVLRGGFRAT